MELVLKYLAISDINLDAKEFSKKEVNEYLTDYIRELCKSQSFDRDLEKRKFEKVFLLLNRATSDETFQQCVNGQFKGRFLDSAYEAITTGLKANIEAYSQSDSDVEILRNKIKSMWSEDDFTANMGTGSRARNRKSRNNIAHGKYLTMNYEEFLSIYEIVITLMRNIKDDILNAAIREQYKRQ